MTSCASSFRLAASPESASRPVVTSQNYKPLASASIMSWQNNGHNRASYNPGPTPQYAYPTGPDNSAAGYAGGFKDEGYDGGRRFEPKKKMRDPIFLVLFIAQVCKVPF